MVWRLGDRGSGRVNKRLEAGFWVYGFVGFFRLVFDRLFFRFFFSGFGSEFSFMFFTVFFYLGLVYVSFS